MTEEFRSGRREEVRLITLVYWPTISLFIFKLPIEKVEKVVAFLDRTGREVIRIVTYYTYRLTSDFSLNLYSLYSIRRYYMFSLVASLHHNYKNIIYFVLHADSYIDALGLGDGSVHVFI